MNTKNYTPAFPFFPILTLIFITLKLTGYIAWSWFWVLAPLWIPAAIFLVILVVFAILYLMDDKRG
jgi:hypothetical protein